MWSVVCVVLVVVWNSRLCSPMMEVGSFKARVDGEGGDGEIVEFGLCG